MAVIDFHSHILPGMDDGSKDSAMSLEMLRMAGQQGVDVMLATSHFYASQNSPEEFLRRRGASAQQLFDQDLSGLPSIILGAEVSFFSGIGQADGIEKLCIGDTNLLLLEMPFCKWSNHTLYEVERLYKRGMVPILAHLERFYRFQTDKKMISALLDLPVYVQINAACLQTTSGRWRAVPLFQRGDAQFLGSDCHNLTSRPPNYGKGRKILEKKLGAHQLAQMDRNASALLGI